EAGGGLEERAQRGAVLRDSVYRPEPDDPVVVVGDIGGHRRGLVIEVERSNLRCDRAGGRGDAPPLGAVWEQLGVALVQADDGVAQPVGGEVLGPPAAPGWVDLDESNDLSVIWTHVELHTDRAAR